MANSGVGSTADLRGPGRLRQDLGLEEAQQLAVQLGADPLGHRHVVEELVEAVGNLGGQDLGVQPRTGLTRRHGQRLPRLLSRNPTWPILIPIG
jgi:hypothetical protein